MRVRAPELHGAGGWIGAETSLAALRGRVVLLHFWTQACINCLRVDEALRELERRYADVLTVVGIHSPKFAHERSHEAVRAAVARHRIAHPVLDDPELTSWDAYAVRAWPTLVLIDRTGREAARWSGEGHEEAIAAEVERLAAEPGGAGAAPAAPPAPAGGVAGEGSGELSFPGKVRAGAGGTRLAIADTGHDRILVTTLGGEVVRELGGVYQPQGVAWDGDDALLVCEEPTGCVWRLGLDGRRELVCGGLASPWDVVLWHGHVAVAEAGRHRIRVVDAAGEAQVVAGTGEENLVDGPALRALLAQPSGLAVTPHDELAFVDAEASALRVLDAPGGSVRTLVGTGLFSWGDADGDAGAARLQHPLGVAAAADGALYVADTFNGLVRVHRGAHLWTVPVTGFREPGGVDVLPDGRLVVADTGNHRLVVLDPGTGAAMAIDVGRPGSTDAVGAPVLAETLVLEPGATLELELDADVGGEPLDRAAGPPVEITAVASDPALLTGQTAFRAATLPARVALELGSGSGRITVELRVATCTDRACRLWRTQRAYDVIVTG